MRTPIKRFETLHKRFNSGKPVWILLPGDIFGQLPMGLVCHTMDRGLVRVPTATEEKAFLSVNGEKL